MELIQMAIKLTAHILNCSKGDSMEKEIYAPQPTASKVYIDITNQVSCFHTIMVREVYYT